MIPVINTSCGYALQKNSRAVREREILHNVANTIILKQQKGEYTKIFLVYKVTHEKK